VATAVLEPASTGLDAALSDLPGGQQQAVADHVRALTRMSLEDRRMVLELAERCG
jgi:hypothetical protein